MLGEKIFVSLICIPIPRLYIYLFILYLLIWRQQHFSYTFDYCERKPIYSSSNSF